ncbi:hypothetical protein [Xanthomonas phage X1]|nr:hypothetical protein [Xanthomonas phage X1]
MRKLVTLRTVAEIVPIEGADAIEVAVVDGWSCVVKKGEFKEGDKAIYFEIDSILPYGDERFAFLMARGCKMQPTEDGGLLEGHRLRTIKLRGQVSQGLLIKPDVAFSDPTLYLRGINVAEGPFLDYRHSVEGELKRIYFNDEENNDLSDVFGVKKYEKPIPAQLAGMIAGNYPVWLPKTDQDRIQNCFGRAPEGKYHAEEKFEGSSMTIYHDGEKLGVTSRNLDLKLEQEGNTFIDVAKASGIFDALTAWIARFNQDDFIPRIAIRGELIGPGVQGNIYGLTAHRFMIYDVFAHDHYLTPLGRHVFLEEFIKPFAGKNVGYVHTLFTMTRGEYATKESYKEFLGKATGKSILADTLREGIVYKSDIQHRGDVFSFKAISPEYLLGEKE